MVTGRIRELESRRRSQSSMGSVWASRTAGEVASSQPLACPGRRRSVLPARLVSSRLVSSRLVSSRLV
eukprot:653434-Hanusia_phi.AAC.1